MDGDARGTPERCEGGTLRRCAACRRTINNPQTPCGLYTCAGVRPFVSEHTTSPPHRCVLTRLVVVLCGRRVSWPVTHMSNTYKQGVLLFVCHDGS